MSQNRDPLDVQKNTDGLSQSNSNNMARMFELMADDLPFGIFWKDLQSCYLGCNQAVARVFGLASPQEIAGLRDSDLRGLSREQADRFVAYDRLVMDQDAPRLGIIETLTRVDGITIWIETNKLPTHDSSGAVNGVFGTWQDITARIAAETRLREREEQLATFVKHAPVQLAMLDREMRYLHVSERWKHELHLGEGDLRGLSHYEVFPNVPERWKSVHRRSLAGEVVRSDEDRFDLMDGTTLWLRWECRPWFEDGGTVGGIIIYSEEITEQKRYATTLQQREMLVRSERTMHLSA